MTDTSTATTPDPAHELLRGLIGERIPFWGDEADTNFTDEDISMLLTYSSNEMNSAAAIGWGMKAAELAKLTDVEESGSARKLSQMYKHAQEMMKHYTVLAAATADQVASAVRAAPRPAGWAVSAEFKVPFPYDATHSTGVHTRMFPGHRFFPVIKS